MSTTRFFKAPATVKPYRNPIESVMAHLPDKARRAYIKQYNLELLKKPISLEKVAIPEDMEGTVLGIWQSRYFGVVAYPSANPLVLARLSINRTEINWHGSFLGGIGWDDLYAIKNQCGYVDHDAVEVFPAENKLVNVANLRHLWVMNTPLPFSLVS